MSNPTSTIVEEKKDNHDHHHNNKKKNCYSNSDKWWAALIAGILFAIIASPFLFGLTNSLFGCWCPTYCPPGGPTLWGLLLHAIVFALLIRLLLQ
jgi:hypothetical protein